MINFQMYLKILIWVVARFDYLKGCWNQRVFLIFFFTVHVRVGVGPSDPFEEMSKNVDFSLCGKFPKLHYFPYFSLLYLNVFFIIRQKILTIF